MSFIEKSYPIFFCLGIFFFIVHFLLYGVGLDQSYFGLFLIYVGYMKPHFNKWIFFLLWVLMMIEIMNIGKMIYERFKTESKTNNKKKKKKKEID